MRQRAPERTSRGASATGAAATGAAALAATAVGAVALGALAVGALAIGRLGVGRARLRRVEIGELAVGRIELGAPAAAAVRRVRAAPGRGDELARFLQEAAARGWPGVPACRTYRSDTDPEVFLIVEEPDGALAGGALLGQAAADGLLSAGGDDPVEAFRSV